jgi:hypothetical protein
LSKNLGKPAFSITTENGPQLKNPILFDLAVRLSRVDRIILSVVLGYHKGLAKKDASYEHKNSPHIAMFLQQIDDAQLGRQEFSAKYLESKELLEYWDTFCRMYQVWFAGHPSYVEEEGDKDRPLDGLNILENEVEPLPALILAAVNSGLLNQNSRITIRRRWLIFDSLMEERYSRTTTERASQSW